MGWGPNKTSRQSLARVPPQCPPPLRSTGPRAVTALPFQNGLPEPGLVRVDKDTAAEISSGDTSSFRPWGDGAGDWSGRSLHEAGGPSKVREGGQAHPWSSLGCRGLSGLSKVHFLTICREGAGRSRTRSKRTGVSVVRGPPVALAGSGLSPGRSAPSASPWGDRPAPCQR